MRKIVIFIVVFSLAGIIFAWKDQDADKIAQALVDRLTCPHVHFI